MEVGNIYKLSGGDRYYYGSSARPINKRFNEHKYRAKQKGGRRIYRHFNSIGWENVTIELVETFECTDRQTLLKKENEYINKYIGDMYCLNSILALN